MEADIQEDGPPSLRVPEPPSRPGQRVDYSHLHFSDAGEVARPAVNADASRITDLTNGLVRVLDDDGSARGLWNPGLSADAMRAGLAQCSRRAPTTRA
ncbi:hypothetical protein MPL1032_240280 [Mesorhizobium plurifarium]|uniref:2-oxoisovalerate dehydrogenase E1 alpha subunit N-terminal domain-containing protein n=1 Tax=Mesorhizobium plurifarium TaxID=69974 RepID=A0A0K2W0T7_MESPL|nr:hypothetical protein MPL1032_240280 [Mesorhizobium plurifarium]